MTYHYDPNSLIQQHYILEGIPPQISEKTGEVTKPGIGPLFTAGKTTWLEMRHRGEISEPIMIGNRPYWRYKDLMADFDKLAKKQNHSKAA
jgi:hypothetical protein